MRKKSGPQPARGLETRKKRLSPTLGMSRLRAEITDILPRVGTVGSRSATLHASHPRLVHGNVAASNTETGLDTLPEQQFDTRYEIPVQSGTPPKYKTISQLRLLFVLRWLGTVGSLLIGFGGLGAGALPVVGDPYDNIVIGRFALGSLLAQLLAASSALVFLGIGLLCLAWLGLSKFVGTPLELMPKTKSILKNAHKKGFRRDLLITSPGKAPGSLNSQHPQHLVSAGQMWRIWASWVVPLIPTAPLFTQDIYSYLANGLIVRLGLNPYSAGPVQLLGSDHPLARSVPFIWANSPSPYGPISLEAAAIISAWTQDTTALGVVSHRLISIVGVIAAGWAITKLAHRCHVSSAAALWLGLLNPISILHLIGGIHNESLLLGFSLVGMELALRAVDRVGQTRNYWWFLQFIGSGVLISCAGMVKVTGFIGLGFAGMALARTLRLKKDLPGSVAIATAATTQLCVMVLSIIALTFVTKIPIDWTTGQGGAATIRSWLSISTDLGVVFGFLGMLLGLGDHTDAMLVFTRTTGILIAAGFMLRMLFATYRGAVHAVGGLGVATLVLVIFFPVVHPWYVLWAVFPLSAWANRLIFRTAVVLYSIPMSMVVLPRGLGLPPSTVAIIYLSAALAFIPIAGVWWVVLRRNGISSLDW